MEVLRRYSNFSDLEQALQRTRSCPARASIVTHRNQSVRSRRHKIKNRLPEAVVTALVADYEAGKSSTELMATYQLGRGTVLQLLAEAGIAMRHQGLSEQETAEAASLYASGLSVVSVADRLERPMSTVYFALKRSGVVIRPAKGGRR